MMRRDELGWVCNDHGRVHLTGGGSDPRARRIALERGERAAMQHLRDHHPALVATLAGAHLERVPKGGR